MFFFFLILKNLSPTYRLIWRMEDGGTSRFVDILNLALVQDGAVNARVSKLHRCVISFWCRTSWRRVATLNDELIGVNGITLILETTIPI